MFSSATSTTTASVLSSASRSTIANAMSKSHATNPMVHSSTATMTSTTLATPYTHQTLTPPPHSRFLAFASRYRESLESRGVPPTENVESNNPKTKTKTTLMMENDERDGPIGNTTIHPPPKARRFWDVVLSPSAPAHNKSRRFWDIVLSPSAPRPELSPRVYIAQQASPVIHVHATDHLPLPLSKPYDHLSLLNQCAAEAEANLAKARTTSSPDSEGTSSSGSGTGNDGLLSPLSFLSHVSSFSSEATDLTAESPDPNRDNTRYTRVPLCESPVEYDHDEDVRGDDVREVMKDLAGRVEDNRREVGRVLGEETAFEGVSEPESPFMAPVPLPLSPYTTYQDDTHMEVASLSPPSPIRPSFLSPCPSTFRLPSSSNSAPFVFQPTFNVDAVDGSMLWPTPYPSLLLRPPRRYGQPNTYTNAATATANDEPPVVPSPRLLDRVLADLDLEEERRDVPMDFRNNGLNTVEKCDCVACVRWISEQGIIAPRPVRPIAIGLMERLVQQWEEEADEVEG